jgi:hypothetical protein
MITGKYLPKLNVNGRTINKEHRSMSNIVEEKA